MDVFSYRSAAAKYRPKHVRVLFVAESPPTRRKDERARYFYFEDVEKADQLWAGLMQKGSIPLAGRR